LQLDFNESAAIAVFGSLKNVMLGWEDPQGDWENAVLGQLGAKQWRVPFFTSRGENMRPCRVELQTF
jgi:hypothetical protein